MSNFISTVVINAALRINDLEVITLKLTFNLHPVTTILLYKMYCLEKGWHPVGNLTELGKVIFF